MTVIAIHPIHRKLAEVILMNTDLKGNLNLGNAERKLILMLLQVNTELVYKLDSLKQLSFMAYELDDEAWHHEICQRIEEIEQQLSNDERR